MIVDESKSRLGVKRFECFFIDKCVEMYEFSALEEQFHIMSVIAGWVFLSVLRNLRYLDDDTSHKFKQS